MYVIYIIQNTKAFAPQKPVGFHLSRNLSSQKFSTSTTPNNMPICIVVEAEIKADRMDDFLDMIEKNAVGSRAEPGCLRFDVLQSADADNKFIFYEVYEGELCHKFYECAYHFSTYITYHLCIVL